jgi:hypothetical protein
MIRTILKTAAIVWMVACTGFVCWSAFNWAVALKLDSARAQGRDQMLESVIAAAQSCKPVALHGKTEKVTLTNPGCPAVSEERK